MRVLILTNLYPTEDQPARGTFIRSQVESLSAIGVEAELLIIEGWQSRRRYLQAVGRLRRRLQDARSDLIHAHYGFSGCMSNSLLMSEFG